MVDQDKYERMMREVEYEKLHPFVPTVFPKIKNYKPIKPWKSLLLHTSKYFIFF
jgi:hypothetical protein